MDKKKTALQSGRQRTTGTSVRKVETVKKSEGRLAHDRSSKNATCMSLIGKAQKETHGIKDRTEVKGQRTSKKKKGGMTKPSTQGTRIKADKQSTKAFGRRDRSGTMERNERFSSSPS